MRENSLAVGLDLSDDDLSTLWRAYAGACEDLGIAVVTGHTGRYDGCAWPMVGGASSRTTPSDVVRNADW